MYRTGERSQMTGSDKRMGSHCQIKGQDLEKLIYKWRQLSTLPGGNFDFLFIAHIFTWDLYKAQSVATYTIHWGKNELNIHLTYDVSPSLIISFIYDIWMMKCAARKGRRRSNSKYTYLTWVQVSIFNKMEQRFPLRLGVDTQSQV